MACDTSRSRRLLLPNIIQPIADGICEPWKVLIDDHDVPYGQEIQQLAFDVVGDRQPFICRSVFVRLRYPQLEGTD